jgi:hypothetical protein
MEKRQSIVVALIGLAILAAGGLWWFTQNAEPAPVAAKAPAAPAAMTAKTSEPLTAPTPVVAAHATESDAVALSEEAVDKAVAEKEEVESQANDLESQVADGKDLIALQVKQIQELQGQLTQLQAGKK